MDIGDNFAVIFGQYSIPIHFVFGQKWFLHFRFFVKKKLRSVGQRSMSSSNRSPRTASHTSCRALSGPLIHCPPLSDQHNGRHCWSRPCCCNRCYLRLIPFEVGPSQQQRNARFAHATPWWPPLLFQSTHTLLLRTFQCLLFSKQQSCGIHLLTCLFLVWEIIWVKYRSAS